MLDGTAAPFMEPLPGSGLQLTTFDVGGDITAKSLTGDFTFTSASGTATITGYTGAGGAVAIPATIDGMPVRAIAPAAFYGISALTSISIPATVTSIGNFAFDECVNLESITVDAANGNYASVGGVLFDGPIATLMRFPMAKAGTFTIPSRVKTIAENAFRGCSKLSGVTLPNGLTTIGFNAFWGCSSLTAFSIPSSVTEIRSGAISDCASLQSITVESANPAYASLDGILYNKSLTTLIRFPNGKSGTVAIPSSVSRIETGAFYKCTLLTSVTIPSSVVHIGNSAFLECTSLEEIAIPGTVRFVGIFAFGHCVQLRSATVGDGVTELGLGMFDSCSNLRSVSLPETLRVIGDQAFSQCVSLPSVVIPNGVTTIGYGAFNGCSSLTSVTIPASVTTIRVSNGDFMANAFGACENLFSISVDPGNPAYASLDGILYNKSFTTLVQCPGGKAGSVFLPSTVTRIGDYAFANNTGLASVSIPNSVTTVGVMAFVGCTSLASVTLPSGLAVIGENAFVGSGLTSVVIPSTVKTIGPSAFASCDELTSVLVSGDVDTIGARAFHGCRNLTSITISGAVVVVGPGAFGEGNTDLIKQGAGALSLSWQSSRTGSTVVESGELFIAHPQAIGFSRLDIRNGGKVTLGVENETVVVNQFQIAEAAQLELGVGRLSVAAAGFNEAQIRAKLISGRNGGTWDGDVGITSTAAGAGSDRAIGYRVDDGVMEIAFAAPGDTNLDGLVDLLDLLEILGSGTYEAGVPAAWGQGDFNYDGVTDLLDLMQVLSSGTYGQGDYKGQPTTNSAAVQTVQAKSFDTAFIFAAIAGDYAQQTTTKRKSR